MITLVVRMSYNQIQESIYSIPAIVHIFNIYNQDLIMESTKMLLVRNAVNDTNIYFRKYFADKVDLYN